MLFDSANQRFKQSDQRLPLRIARGQMPHRNPLCLARSAIGHGRAGDDNAGELAQLSDCIGIDRAEESARIALEGACHRRLAPGQNRPQWLVPAERVVLL